MAGTMLSVNATGLAKLGKQLRHSHPAVYRELHRAVLAEARKVAEIAKRNSSWSSRIPGTIKASAVGVSTAKVRAGGGTGSAAPHAKAYEHAGREGTFRHPVFADPEKGRSEWTWVSQDARPFLHPAAMERLPETVKVLGDAVIHAVDIELGKV